MGYSISWLATYGMQPQALRHVLGLQETERIGDYQSDALVGGVLVSGWYLIIAGNRCDHAIVSAAMLRATSMGGTALGVSIEEHVMFCSAGLWLNGQQLWDVRHSGDRDRLDLSVQGTPPLELDELRAAMMERQRSEPPYNGVDWFFEIPLELAKQAVGFKHDEDAPPGTEATFRVLELIPGGTTHTATRPWWQFRR